MLRAWLQRPMQPTDEPRYSGARQPNIECGITTARATRTEMHSGRLARLGSNPDPDTMITRRWSAIGGCASALARSHPLLGEKECGLLCATSPSESSPSLTRARYAGTAGLPGPPQYPARCATPNCHLIKDFWRQWGFCASTASEVGRVKISILLWRYGRIAGKLVPPWGNGRILVRMNDGISLLEVMRT